MRLAKKLMNTFARAQQFGRADMACRLRDEKNDRDFVTEHLTRNGVPSQVVVPRC
jgi:hypothetical protein